MNNLQSNERHLADKLRQAPVPDVNRGWEQMQELLDREMPEAAAGGWAGNKRWWWMGITAALIMVAVWLTQELNQREQNGIAVNTQSKDNAPVVKNKEANNQTVANDVAASQGSVNDDKASGDQKETKAVVADEKNIEKKEEGNAQIVTQKPEKTFVASIKQGLKKSNTSNRTTSDKSYTIKNNNKAIKQFDVSNNEGTNKVTTTDYASSDLIIPGKEANGIVVHETVSSRQIVSAADEFETMNSSPSDAIAVSGKTDKAYLKQLRKKMIKEDNRRMSRSGMSGNFGDDGREITFAAGITVPQTFALGQQQASPYSVSGKSNRFMDYLPAPFFQYHINNKLFLQTEFHFQSPQYTNRLLLARSTTQPSTNVSLQKNVYLEKLYYFNIPLNIYYTPARNFSIGSGLQYSSLLSGVASFEERRMEGQTTSSYQSVTRRFKDDSVAAKFAPSEWRYQFDANYYFKRFTLGLRYNQALKDFVNLQVGPGLPVTQDRNKSFLLYLRFNIWEERKKD